MAKIRVPQPLEKLIEKYDFMKDIVPLLMEYKATNSEGKYLPWDKFKWRVKSGTSEEAAWLATKISRQGISKYINALQADKPNVKFSYCVPDSLFAQLHKIDKMTGGGHALEEGAFLTSQEKDKYLVKNLIMEEAITSSQLEGASTTRKVAKKLLEENRVPKDKSEQMIFNNYQLMKAAVENKNEPLSIDFILKLHQIATFKAIDNDAVAGEFREDNEVTVADLYNEVAHTPPCYSSIRERLTALCEFANADHEGKNSDTFLHPLVKAIILHFMIGYIHPFGDGNGRTARALFYWSMLNSGYWLFEYVSISKLIQEKRSEYDAAYIYTESDEFDLTYFIYHQVDIVMKAVNALLEHIESKRKAYYEFARWVEKSPLSKNLKRGQIELLKEAVKSPGKVFTVKQLASDFDVTENTARGYLNDLVDLDLLMASKEKKGKMILYFSPQGLTEKLKL